MQRTTAPSHEGHRMTRCGGAVAGEALAGTQVVQDRVAGLRGIALGAGSGMLRLSASGTAVVTE
ncbi:hypothetical protein [Ideonella alba]|uniref:Uncharacterized protein n=1 Tax=Ideonella alba TaxID=2824118 RepID=A0A940Y833_9BURK|nr:hypothetical protein [Ideonella alba]MBQ0929408.1 hypothetical protein [Ideonella alba]